MLPFWWKTIQKTITIAKMTTSAEMRFHSGHVFNGCLLGDRQDVLRQLERPCVFDRLFSFTMNEITIEEAEQRPYPAPCQPRGEERRAEAEFLPQHLRDNRRQECADVDSHVENVIGRIAKRTAGGIKVADDRRDIWLEKAVADEDSTSDS